MASPFDQTSSKNSEKMQQMEESSQIKLTPNLPRTPVKKRVVGFDCEFVEQPPKAIQTDCPVCLLVLREPHQLTCCGYSFCQTCVDRVEKDKKPCPTCNKVEFSVFPNKGLQRSLYEFHIRCSYEKEGCQWTGELGELEKHLNESPILGQQFTGCEFTEIECSDCGKSFQRRYFKAHQLEQHPFSCEYCHNYESYFEDVVNNHYPICGFRPVPCPNECGVYPERQNIEHHVSEDCPLRVVDCDFNYTGCDVRLPRKDMPAHLAENLVPHMAQLAIYNQKKVQEKDQQLMRLTEDLKEKLEENSKQISQLEKENEALSKSFLEKKEENVQLREQLSEKDKATEEAFTQFKEHITKEIAQLKQKQESAVQLGENALKREVTQLRQEITKLQRMQKNAISREENEVLNREVTQLRQDKLMQDAAMQQEIAELQRLQKNAVSREENEALEETVTRLQEEVDTNEETMRHEMDLLKEELDEYSRAIENAMRADITQLIDQVQSYRADAQCVELNMREFGRHWQDGDEWYSDPFYTHPRGYKMCLRVDAKGWGDGKGTHVSVFVHMMRGEHDDRLEWPFRGEVTVRLDKVQSEGKCSFTVCFNTFANSSTCVCGQRVTTSERALDGMGKSKFLPHKKLGQFLRHDCLCFQATRVSNMHLDQGRQFVKKSNSCTPVLPFEFTVRDFEQHKTDNGDWYSPPFYTHPRGYKMCLLVDPIGHGDGKGTHVAVFVYMMRGEHDNFLEWPFRGHITIQLLNQIEDKEHREITIDFTAADVKNTSRVITGERARCGWGLSLFISYCKLNYDQTRNCQYLKYDSLSFRISSAK